MKAGAEQQVEQREQTADEFGQVAEMLHVSNVAINAKKPAAGTRYRVFVHMNSKKHVIANLVEGSLENYALDLYFRPTETPKFSVESSGKGSVSFTGYWESAPDVMDDDDEEFGMGPMDMDQLDQEEEADLDPFTKSNIDAAKQNAL